MNSTPAFDPTSNPSPAPAATPDWREIGLLFVGSRLLIWMVAGLSLLVVGKGPFFDQQTPGAGWFLRWDAGFYVQLATHGYFIDPAAHTANVEYLPLYPLLVYLGSLGGLIKPWLVGYVVSLACLWGSCVWLGKAVAREWADARLATLSVAFLLFCPVSFFFSSPFSESLFLLLVIGSIDASRRRRWWLAGVLGALAALTRFIGVILIVPLLWQYVESEIRTRRPFRPNVGAVLACLTPLAGTLIYSVFMWIRFGDPLLYFHSQALYHGRQFSWFYLFLSHASFSHLPAFYQIWFASTLAATFGLLLAGVLFRIPLVYSVYGLTAAGVYISARFVDALPRYCSVIFPLYVVLALIARRWPRLALPLLAASTALLALSVVLFVNGYWFT